MRRAAAPKSITFYKTLYYSGTCIIPARSCARSTVPPQENIFAFSLSNFSPIGQTKRQTQVPSRRNASRSEAGWPYAFWVTEAPMFIAMNRFCVVKAETTTFEH